MNEGREKADLEQREWAYQSYSVDSTWAGHSDAPDFLQPSKIHIACQEIAIAAEDNKLVIDWQVI